MQQSDTQQGDERIEHERWRLAPERGELAVRYDRVVVIRSRDGQPFVCNGQTAFVTGHSAEISASLVEGQLVLQERTRSLLPGLCREPQAPLWQYTVTSTPDHLVLTRSTGGVQHLLRSTATALVLPGDGSPAQGASIQGIWEWQQHSETRDGDLLAEQEEWYLEQQGTDITGHYTRQTAYQRKQGVFACNQQPVQNQLARFEIRGQRLGERVFLTETHVQAGISVCETSLPRLDSYRGTIYGKDELVLEMGGRHQVLRRRAIPMNRANELPGAS